MEKKRLSEKLRSEFDYVEAGVLFTTAGIVRPEWIVWHGERFPVQKVLHVASDNTAIGSAPFLTFLCLIDGKRVKLFYDGTGRFFMRRMEGEDA